MHQSDLLRLCLGNEKVRLGLESCVLIKSELNGGFIGKVKIVKIMGLTKIRLNEGRCGGMARD